MGHYNITLLQCGHDDTVSAMTGMQGPAARIRMPHGFHTTWVSAERLARGD
ncbi:MAG: hypothetical protein ABIR94_17455 [Rubrivivax sp.]